MDYWMLIFQLFGTFFLIGMFTFGGGYAVMSLIQSEIVEGRGWISESTFTDIAAISQMTPGPIGLNCSTYVGYEVGGVMGSAVASIAIVLPSFIITMLIVKCYFKFHESPVFGNVMDTLKPAVAGLIGAAAIGLMFSIGADGVRLITENFPDWKSWVVFAAALTASLLTKTGPIATLAGAAVLGLVLYL